MTRRREYPLTSVPGAIGIMKVRNAVRRFFGANAELVNAKNIRVNGELRGVSGFLKYKDGRFVYFNTERSCYGPLSDKVMFRAAKNEKDYTGGYNCWCNDHPFDLVKAIDRLLQTGGDEYGWNEKALAW